MILGSVTEANKFYNTSVDETADVMPTDYSSCLTVDEAAMCALVETMNDYEMYEEAVREAEMEFVQEHGVEPIYEEAAIKSIVQNGIAMVKEWLSRILGVIDRFMKEVAAKLAVAKTKIIKPNADKLAKADWKENWNFEDYDYRNISKCLDADLVDANKERTFNAYKRYGIEDGNTSVKAIKAAALGNKITIDVQYVGSIDPIEIVSNFKDGVDAINKQKKAAKETANNIIKEIKEKMRDAEKKSEKDMYKMSIGDISKINALNTNLVTAKLSLLMGQLNQAYKIAGIMARSSSNIGSKVNDAGASVSKAAGAAGEKIKGAAKLGSKKFNAAKDGLKAGMAAK